MKRELAFALEAQSQLIGSLGRTRSSKVQNSASNEVSEGRSRKRFKGSVSVMAEGNGSIDLNQEIQEPTGQCNGFAVYTRNRRLKSENPDLVLEDNVIETVVVQDETMCVMATPMSKDVDRAELGDSCVMEESNGVIVKPVVNEGGLGEVVNVVADEKNEVNNYAPVVTSRRFTRSALKPRVEEAAEVSEAQVGESGTGTAAASGTPAKKLELKMSKKIALVKSPRTMKELLQTGLLEGLSVVYNCGLKGPKLQGTVKDNGILCSCKLCGGSRVIAPSKFELHARNSYRHAAQFICLENGKSLLEVVEACKRSCLDSLEETIHSFIGSLPVKESSVCQNCKGPFFATFALGVAQFCESCTKSRKAQASPAQRTGTKARSSKPALALSSCGNASVRGMAHKRSQGNIFKKSLKSDVLNSLQSASVQDKSLGKRIKKLSKPDLGTKDCASSSAFISSPNKNRGKIAKKSGESTCPSISPQMKSQWKMTKKDQRLHKLVFEEGGLLDGTEVAYYSRGQKLLEGYKRGSGIFCRCCHSEVSPSQFEAHAGWASRRKPYGYIYTSNGVSLHEFALSLLLKGRRYSPKESDDVCIICADGGNLLLCDGCPRAFHIECASLISIPRGKWYCKYCQNMFQREKFVEHNANAKAAGRVSGVDPIEQITKRCIRIVTNPEDAEVIACVLCRGYDFSKSGFGPRTVILCDQCEKEYHVGCLKKYKMADLKELPEGKWFCCIDCKRICSALQNVLIGGEEKLPDSLLDVMKKKHEDKNSENATDVDVRWRVLRGKIATPETRLLLSKAVAIFHDCFDPIVDSVTGRDFIPSMVYGRSIRGQDFGGIYCAVLTVNSSVVSAAIFRVFGRDIAELPLVATSIGNHGKGYFQILFNCIEKLLAFMNVRNFVLPAADEAESIWTEKFGFEKIPPETLMNYRRTCWQMVTFKGTSMLQKVVPRCRIINQDVAGPNVSNEPVKGDED